LKIVQSLVADVPASKIRRIDLYSRTPYSPPANLQPGTCESLHPFPTEALVSRPHKMALLQEAKRIAAEFEFSDEEVQKNVVEFISQMSVCSPYLPVCRTIQNGADEI